MVGLSSSVGTAHDKNSCSKKRQRQQPALGMCMVSLFHLPFKAQFCLQWERITCLCMMILFSIKIKPS